jgi:hypothetical protein
MTPEDHKYMVTLILSVAGIQLTITSFFTGLLFHLINTKIQSIENRITILEKSMKEFQDEIRIKIDLLIK